MQGSEQHHSSTSRPRPSETATARLEHSLHETLDEYRETLTEDLQLVDSAVECDMSDQAVEVIRAHILSLEQMHDRLNRIVAGAVAEREAEAVLDEMQPAAASAAGAPHLSPGGSAEESRAGHVRRGLAAAAAVMSLAVMATNWPPTPRDPLLIAVGASEEALAAAEAARSGGSVDADQLTSLSVDLHQAIAELPLEMRDDPKVREWLGVVLVEQHVALTRLLGTVPDVEDLLTDLERLAAELGIDLPHLSRPADDGVPASLARPTPASPASQSPEGADEPVEVIGQRAPTVLPPTADEGVLSIDGLPLRDGDGWGRDTSADPERRPGMFDHDAQSAPDGDHDAGAAPDDDRRPADDQRPTVHSSDAQSSDAQSSSQDSADGSSSEGSPAGQSAEGQGGAGEADGEGSEDLEGAPAGDADLNDLSGPGDGLGLAG